MNISKISFKGYREIATVIASPDERVVGALTNIRPYLKQIGYSMPYPRDLVITLEDDGCDTTLNAYDYNPKKNKAKLLATANEHHISEYGDEFIVKVFNGLKKNSNRDFKNIAADFVMGLHKIKKDK